MKEKDKQLLVRQSVLELPNLYYPMLSIEEHRFWHNGKPQGGFIPSADNAAMCWGILQDPDPEDFVINKACMQWLGELRVRLHRRCASRGGVNSIDALMRHRERVSRYRYVVRRITEVAQEWLDMHHDAERIGVFQSQSFRMHMHALEYEQNKLKTERMELHDESRRDGIDLNDYMV